MEVAEIVAKNTHANRYTRLIEAIFLKHYQLGATAIAFERDEITQGTVEELGMVLPKNLGDVLYSFRYRTQLPSSILEVAPRKGMNGSSVTPAGRSRYSFVLVRQSIITPSEVLVRD